MDDLIAIALLWVACSYIFGGNSKKKKYKKESGLSNTTVMWLCPLFWPLLIAKMFFGGKNVKSDNSYSDWEEFKKRNGK